MILSTASGTSNRPLSGENKLISPTLKFDASDSDNLKVQEDKKANPGQSRLNVSQRFLHPVTLDSSREVNYKINVPNFTNLPPLRLGYRYITNLARIDSSTPPDLYCDENINKSGTGLDYYYFDYEKGLGDFSRFEKAEQINLPDKFFEEHNSTEAVTKMGLFPEINRAWITVDNKLVFWNFRAPQSSFNTNTQFLTINQIRHSILAVCLVEPKPGIFVKEVNHLLLIATTLDIHIYIVKYDKALNNLEVFNPDLSVSTQGLSVNNFAVNKKSKEIYFSGEGGGTNVWRLDYSSKSTFSKNRCEKVNLTKGGLSNVLALNKLPGLDIFNFSESSTSDKKSSPSSIPENVHQLLVDHERDILYTLSNKSVIRVYQLQSNQEQFTSHSQITPSEIFRGVSTIFIDSQNFKSFLKFRIMNIQTISPKESSNIQLIAITNYGFRILLKLGSASTFSFISSALNASKLKLSVASIKFPPSRETPNVSSDLDTFTRQKQYVSQLIGNQQKSQLLKNTKFSKIISPGVFLCVKRTKGSDKLFICIANYGFLKKNSKLVEDAEFVKIGGNDESNPIYIHDIVQLTPSMNATNTPNGYANVMASQYAKQPLKFAILTNYGMIIYKFKTSDQILRYLDEETIGNFIEENGYEETCSTLLYLSCSYGYRGANDLMKRKAQILFSTCGNNPRFSETTQANTNVANPLLPHHQPLVNIGKSVDQSFGDDQVVLSDRFYGTCLLVSRLFRDIWNNKVFLPFAHIKINPSGQLDSSSVKEDGLLIKGINIDKKQVEYFIGSVIVLLEFFAENGNSIQGLNAPSYSADPSRFENEVSLRAEHIAFTSLIKSLSSIKEGLSFLMVVIEEIEINQTNFNDIIKFLSVINQLNFLTLSFKDLLLPTREVRDLVKDLLSSIINKNILKGGSIDLIAASLQGRCGSFCSTDDVFIFKAIENLTKAKNIGSRDYDLKISSLNNAVELFEEAYESLTLENIENSVNIMLELDFYTGAVKLLLKLASKIGSPSKLAAHANVTPFESLTNTAVVKSNPSAVKAPENNDKRHHLYRLIFTILTKVDMKSIQIIDTNDQLAINEFIEVRDATYDTCFASKDKYFHYEFYQWFIDQNLSERLLEVDTPFVLPFLEQKAENDLAMSDLLWLYYAKRENYYSSASILYTLAISEFKIDLQKRVEYLSRANGFCNCVCPPNLRQKMIQLSSLIQEFLEVANVQLDVLSTIEKDARISSENKKEAAASLNFKILGISELFNIYTDPLGYYELCLLIFKTSDYKNTDDILKRWELLLEKIFHEFSVQKQRSEPLYISIANAMTSIGSKISSNDLVFPVDELFKLISTYVHESVEEDPSTQKPPRGALVDIFIRCGVPFDKLYYEMKSLIQQSTSEVYPGFNNFLKSSEMPYLIQTWYYSDSRLREVISSDKVRRLDQYSVENDPIFQYVNESGVLF